MKVVINTCYGGFSLSRKAVKRLAELNGKECYTFKSDGLFDNVIYEEVTENEAHKGFCYSFSVKNPTEYLKREKDWRNMTVKEKEDWNALYSSISLSERPEDRSDPKLIQVVEELGKEADGDFAELKIVEIPDGVEYEIDEYDGIESIHEKHRSWS